MGANSLAREVARRKRLGLASYDPAPAPERQEVSPDNVLLSLFEPDSSYLIKRGQVLFAARMFKDESEERDDNPATLSAGDILTGADDGSFKLATVIIFSRVIGAALAEMVDGEYKVKHWYVGPTMRGRGIGKRLLVHMGVDLPEINLPAEVLELADPAPNAPLVVADRPMAGSST